MSMCLDTFCYNDLFINARIVCQSVRICVRFFESLAGPFLTLVGSFNSFLRSEISATMRRQ